MGICYLTVKTHLGWGRNYSVLRGRQADESDHVEERKAEAIRENVQESGLLRKLSLEKSLFW